MEKIARSCREGGVVRRVENHGLSQHRRWLGSSGEAGWWLRLRGLQARASHFPPVSGLACCPRPHRSFLLREAQPTPVLSPSPPFPTLSFLHPARPGPIPHEPQTRLFADRTQFHVERASKYQAWVAHLTCVGSLRDPGLSHSLFPPLL